MANPAFNINTMRDLFSCPLSYELFQDPVTEEEGTCSHTFERTWIQEWIVDNPTCPLSRSPLRLDQLIANERVQSASRLLDPERVEPLTSEQQEFIQSVANDLMQRVAPRVPPEVHQSLAQRIAEKKASKNDYMGCQIL